MASFPSLTAPQIIAACCEADRNTVYKTARLEIIRVGQLAIKFGRVTAAEANNQLHAYDILDAELCRVPAVYAYFRSEDIDYLVMEFIDGDKKRAVNEAEISNIVKIVKHIHSFTSTTPGPVVQDAYCGPLWSPDELVCFRNKDDLSAYVNSRLRANYNRFTLTGTPLVFNHGDIALRNLIFGDNYICLLDWECAGYFPRTAEIATLRLGIGDNERDLQFHHSLEEAVLRDAPLSTSECIQAQCWQELAVNHVRYYWPTEEEKTNSRRRRRRRVREHDAGDATLT